MSECISHDRIVGIAEHEVAVRTVTALVGCVLPHFADDCALVSGLLFYGLPHLSYKAVGQFVRNIEPEARSAS